MILTQAVSRSQESRRIKFTVEKADDRWYLFLRRGESPDHESLDDGAIKSSDNGF